MARKKKPGMTCDRCGIFGFNPALADRTHVRTLQGGACGGVWRSMKDGEIAECPACNATGYASGGRCSPCDGRGWIR